MFIRQNNGTLAKKRREGEFNTLRDDEDRGHRQRRLCGILNAAAADHHHRPQRTLPDGADIIADIVIAMSLMTVAK